MNFSNKKHKALVLLPAEEYFSPDNGGALATWTYQIYRILDGINSAVICPVSKTYYPNIGKVGLPVRLFNRISAFIPLKKASIFIRYNLYPLLAAIYAWYWKASFIHIHNRPIYVIIIKSFYSNMKVVLHMNNDHLLHIPKTDFIKTIARCDLIICASEYIKKGIEKRAAENHVIIKSIAVVNNGSVEISEIAQSKNAEQIECLFIGRLVPEKGIRELIEAFSLAHQKDNNLRLTVIGNVSFNTSDTSSFVKELHQVADMIPNAITFMGHLSRDVIIDHLRKADIYLAPSVWNDPFPLSVIEGMAAGLPIIATNRGGIPEALQGNGIYVEPENTVQFSEAIVNLARNKSFRQTIGQKNLDRFKGNYTWACIADQFVEAIMELDIKTESGN